MKKWIFVLLAAVFLAVGLPGVPVAAADKAAVVYYDVNGNPITLGGMYYNQLGEPCYNAHCYYVDADGNTVNVGGCRAYYYDADGNLVAGTYYYDADGNPVSQPSAYPGGYGCGQYNYDENGNLVCGMFFYDENGNLVAGRGYRQSSGQSTTTGGCCGGYGRGRR